MALVVETVPITAVTRNPANARCHPDRNLAAIRASLRRFGQRKPVVVDASGVIVAGNGTHEAMEAEGFAAIAIVRAADLSPEDARAYGIADNRSGELAAWDDDALAAALGTDPDPASLGFDEADLARLLGGRADLQEGGDDPDETPDVAQLVVSKPGDVWRLGRHTLVCGDATDQADVDRALCGTQADMVWTDPPYGVEYVGKTPDALMIDNDDEQSVMALLLRAFDVALRASKPGAAWYVSAPSGPLHLLFGGVLRDLGVLRQTLVWVKDAFVLGHSDYHYRHEHLYYGWAPGGAHRQPADRTQDSVWEVDRPRRSAEHPTMKPVELVARALRNSSTAGDIVLDPFAGSGTTVIAAELTGRVAAAVELDPRYCDVVCRRFQQFTGDVPILDTTGEPHDFTPD